MKGDAAARQCSRWGLGGEHCEGTVPPRAQLTNVGGVDAARWSAADPRARLEYRVDPARIELRLPVGLRRREPLQHRRLDLLHPLRSTPATGRRRELGEAARAGGRGLPHGQ